jgi:predicted nucleic acid-binding Zn ribbon protein
MNDDPLTDCPECGGNNYKRVITNVGVIFKGSGFHVTDYKSTCKIPKKAPADDTSKEKPAESTSADSGSKETKETKESAADKAVTKSDSGTKKSTEAA